MLPWLDAVDRNIVAADNTAAVQDVFVGLIHPGCQQLWETLSLLSEYFKMILDMKVITWII